MNESSEGISSILREDDPVYQRDIYAYVPDYKRGEIPPDAAINLVQIPTGQWGERASDDPSYFVYLPNAFNPSTAEPRDAIPTINPDMRSPRERWNAPDTATQGEQFAQNNQSLGPRERWNNTPPTSQGKPFTENTPNPRPRDPWNSGPESNEQ